MKDWKLGTLGDGDQFLAIWYVKGLQGTTNTQRFIYCAGIVSLVAGAALGYRYWRKLKQEE